MVPVLVYALGLGKNLFYKSSMFSIRQGQTTKKDTIKQFKCEFQFIVTYSMQSGDNANT